VSWKTLAHATSGLSIVLSGAVAQAIEYSGTNFELSDEYRWSEGQEKVEMIESNKGFCFLTFVSGSFEGDGEAIFVTIDGGKWILYGRAQQEGIQARARCIEIR
jgi:hypothetical protein